MLNIEALREIYVKGSIFDSSYGYRLEKAKFLKRLSSLITLPAMPEFETVDYLSTQAISDYLANWAAQDLDGIIYRSVQAGTSDLNVALFWKSSCVDRIEYPKGTEIKASLHTPGLNEDMVPSYNVWEKVPENNDMEDEKVSPFLFDLPSASFTHEREKDQRTPTLRLDIGIMSVHHIESIRVETQHHHAGCHRMAKSASGN